jgi:hypothetical protein
MSTLNWQPHVSGRPDTDLVSDVNGCACIVYFYSDRWWFRVEVGERSVCEVAADAEAAKAAAIAWAERGADAVSAAFVAERERRISEDIARYLAACPERVAAFSPGYSEGFRQGQIAMVRAMTAHAGLDEVLL